MSTYGSLEDLLKNQNERYVNSCIDGKCSCCGECCTDLLPLTDAELKRLKNYLQREYPNLPKNLKNCKPKRKLY